MKEGMSINDWKVVEEADEGRVGRAFVVCRDEAPERLFVLKLWRNDQPGIGKDVNRKEAAILRLGMENTPGRLPSLIEEGKWHGLPFFVMERIEGVDYPIPEKAYRAFCVEAFRALGELHGWIYHCDLTPSHLGWKDGKIAFIDFDNALTPKDAPKNKDGIGTDPYIAPEVASRGEVSARSDIYSLAMILIERCPKRLRECFEPVLGECLRPEPGDRPRSAALVAERLRTCKPPHHRFKVAVKWAAVAVAVGVVGLVTVNTGLYFYRRAEVERKYGDRIEMKVHLRAGLKFYERGDMKNAIRHLRLAERLGSTEAKARLDGLQLRRW